MGKKAKVVRVGDDNVASMLISSFNGQLDCEQETAAKASSSLGRVMFNVDACERERRE